MVTFRHLNAIIYSISTMVLYWNMTQKILKFAICSIIRTLAEY